MKVYCKSSGAGYLIQRIILREKETFKCTCCFAKTICRYSDMTKILFRILRKSYLFIYFLNRLQKNEGYVIHR